MSKPTFKRLYFDIEVTPYEGLFWRPGYQITIGPENITKEAVIICVAYKWSHQKKVHCLKWDEEQDDAQMITEFIQVLDEADEIIGHNGRKFDLAWIRTRAMFHSIPMSYDFPTVDTLTDARGKFRLASNKLDYIARFLGLGSKKPTGFDLWKQVKTGDPKALKKMTSYCRHDVVLLEQVFEKMLPYLPARANRASVYGRCPECDSEDVIINKRRVNAAGTKRIQLQCRACYKYFTTTENKLGKEI